MHKHNYIQLYQGGGLFGGIGSLFGGLFGKKKTSALSGLASPISQGVGLAGSSMGATGSSAIRNTNPTTSSNSFGSAMGIGSGLVGGLSGLLGNDSNNTQLTDTEKTTQTADAVVGGVTNGLMSSGVPVLMAAGAGLKAIDGLGGFLMKNNATSKAANNFKLNADVMGSSGYTGTAAGADAANRSGQAYKKAGLFGKLFSNTGKIQQGFQVSNTQQNQAAGIMKESNLAKQGALSSADMFSNNLMQKNYNGSMWSDGTVQFGKQGGTLTEAGSNATKSAETWKKLGKASKQVNLSRMKAIGSKVPRSQQGGALTIQPHSLQGQKPTIPLVGNHPMKKDHVEYKHNIEKEPEHGYTKWLGTLPQRLRETNDYDLKGYFDKYGPVGVTGDMHLTDEFKKPNHVTFSNESIYSTDDEPGGEWRQAADKAWEFVPSPWNIKNVGLDSLRQYFKQHEPNARLVEPPTVVAHEEGGTINVIAEGAFHSRKHNLKEQDHLKDAEMTDKGIPVVSVKDSNIKQHAEVERDELILHKALTKRLEALFEEGTDEAAIQAGRIIAREIVKNTRDSKKGIIENA